MTKRRIIKIALTASIAGLFFLCLNLLADYWFHQKLHRSSQGIEAQEVNAQPGEILCLVFALDGVPFNVVRQLQAEGYFKGFKTPGKLVSTFPSLSRPAFSRILLGGKPYGYERLYFNGQENEIKGFKLLQKVFSTKKEHKDYSPKLHFIGFPGYIAYAFPEQFTDTTLEVFKDRLKAFTGTEFIAYMGISDSIAHVEGRKKLIEFLKRISGLLDEIRSEIDRPMNVVMFSDHGNNLMPNQWVDVADALTDNGFKDVDTLHNPNDFVLLRNGFVSAAAIHSNPENSEAMAKVLSRVEGIDLSVYRSGDAVTVHGHNGIAQVRRVGDQYQYQPVKGDPLGLLPLLKARGYPSNSDSMPYLHDKEWWEITKAHYYPDPLQRIWLSLHDLVQHPPTVLVSFKEGYSFGPKVFSGSFLRRVGTHGALHGSQSNGFLMTDFKEVASINRPEVVARLLQSTEAVKKGAIKAKLAMKKEK